MRWLLIVLARIRALFHRDAITDEIREEMDFHLDMRAVEYTRAGLPRREAVREAARRFGNVAVLRDKGYDVRGGGVIEFIWQDIRYGVRSLRQAPTFTAVALTVLALAIGASTAIFSVVDAVLLRGLPYDESDRIAAVLGVDTRHETTFGNGSSTTQTFLDWRGLQQSFDALAMVGTTSVLLLSETGQPDVITGQQVTAEFFAVLRAKPLFGRLFTQEDEVPGDGKVLILSHGLWQRRFGGNPGVVGQAIEVNRQPWRVIGVMPPDFSYPPASDKPTGLYVPQTFRQADRVRGGSHNYNGIAIGRLKRGTSLAAAEAQMKRVAATLDQQYPAWEPGWSVRLMPLHERLVGKNRHWMLLLLGSVGLVLLIACANVANLLLARASTRSREMGIRSALGAGRARIARALLIESLVLAVTAGILGVALAYAGVQILRAWLPEGVPRVADIAVDLRVLGAAIGTSVGTGLLFGLAPSVQASRLALSRALNDGGRSSTPKAGVWLRHAFVVGEVSVAVVLLVGAGLFVSSFARVVRIEPGFEYRNTLVLGTGLRRDPAVDSKMEDFLARGGAHVSRVIDAVRRVPGVTAVAAVAGGSPLTNNWSRVQVTLPGQSEMKDDASSLDYRRVSPEFFALLRVPLIGGRMFSDADRAGAARVLVVNESAARRYWPGRDPIGQHVSVQGWDREVIGIVADVRQYGPEQLPREGAFVPWAQEPSNSAELLIRTSGDPMALLPAIKAAAWAVDQTQSLSPQLNTLEGYMDRLIAARRFNMALIGLLGALGLVIAAVGVFGVIAFTVAQRTPEIGVRLALGATPAGIVAMVLRSAVALVASGLAIGTAAASLLTSSAEAFLFEIKPTDVRVFATALTVLALAGLAAAAIPARRAAAVDPLRSLRES